MERQGNKIIILFLMMLSLNARAGYRSEIYNAYIGNNMSAWKISIDRMENVNPKNNEFLLELVNYQYGYIAWCIGNKRNKEAATYLDLAEKNLKTLSGNSRNLSLVNSYKAAFYGYRIGLNKLSAPFLGPKSVDCARMAISSDSRNPLGYVQYANIQFYMPAVFGGSKKEALEYYLKALELMEQNNNDLIENWNYLSLLTVIAQSYAYLDDYSSSVVYLEKALKTEPDFSWVKNELYPQVNLKLKK